MLIKDGKAGALSRVVSRTEIIYLLMENRYPCSSVSTERMTGIYCSILIRRPRRIDITHKETMISSPLNLWADGIRRFRVLPLEVAAFSAHTVCLHRLSPPFDSTVREGNLTNPT